MRSTSTTSSTPKQLEALLCSLPESIKSRPGVGATLDKLGSAAGTDGKSTNKSALTVADELFAGGEYEQAAKMYQESLQTLTSDEERTACQLKRVQALVMSGDNEARYAYIWMRAVRHRFLSGVFSLAQGEHDQPETSDREQPQWMSGADGLSPHPP